jgi:hypothetical protein
LGNWDGKCGGLNGCDVLDCEKKRKHIRETDEPRACNAAYHSEWGQDFGAYGFFCYLSCCFTSLECVYSLQHGSAVSRIVRHAYMINLT